MILYSISLRTSCSLRFTNAAASAGVNSCVCTLIAFFSTGWYLTHPACWPHCNRKIVKILPYAMTGVYFTMGASLHVPGTAHEITLSVQAICAVLGTLCPERELHPHDCFLALSSSPFHTAWTCPTSHPLLVNQPGNAAGCPADPGNPIVVHGQCADGAVGQAILTGE